MKKKKLIIIVILILILIRILPLVSDYAEKYSIIDNELCFKEKIIERINIDENIELKQNINIDNKKYILFTYNNNIGDAEFIRGLNKKYKIGETGYGNMPFQYKIIATNKAKYFIIGGKNRENKINMIKLNLNNKEYFIKVPQDKYYLSYCKINNNTNLTPIDISNIVFYDKNNHIITKEVLNY